MEKYPFKILVVFYSFTGHTAKLVEHIAQGAREVKDADVIVRQAPEILPNGVFEQYPQAQKAREVNQHIPIATIEELISADGIAFGTPVHFGSFSSQIKQFIDQLAPVFLKGTMVGKPAACFASAGSIHGGEEAALISLMIPLLNLGMIPVGVPYPVQGESSEFDAGSPYGAVFVSGHKGDKELSDGDKKIARILGKRLSAMAKVMKYGSMQFSDCQFLASKYE